MRTRIILLPLLVLCLLLGACLGDTGNRNDVAVVDISRLIRDSEPGKQAQAFLESVQKDFNDRLMAQQEKVQANKDDQKAMQTLETMYVSMQQRMQTEEQNVTNVLIERILQTVKEYRAKNGYAMLLRSEAVVDHDGKRDVTDAILDEVNKLKIDFKPVTTDTSTLAPAAPQEGADAAAAPTEAAPAEEGKAEEGKADTVNGVGNQPAAGKPAEAAAPEKAAEGAK